MRIKQIKNKEDKMKKIYNPKGKRKQQKSKNW